MKDLIFEDRAQFRFVAHYKTKNKEHYLELSAHYGNWSLFALEHQITYLNWFDNPNNKIPMCLGGYDICTNSKTKLVNYIKTILNKNPIFPSDFNTRVAKERKYLNKPEIKALSYKFPELRKQIYGD